MDVHLLVLQEAAQLLAGLFPIGFGKFVRTAQSLRFEAEFFRQTVLSLFGDSLLIKVLEFFEDLPLFFLSEAALFQISIDDDRDENPKSFSGDHSALIRL